MKFDAVEDIARAVRYEGYLLYPYRRSALKNRQRWLFGRLLPRDFSVAHGESEPWWMQIECLIVGSLPIQLQLSVRGLRLLRHGNSNEDCGAHETAEEEIDVSADLEQITSQPLRETFAVGSQLAGAVTLTAAQAGENLFRLSVTIENLTPYGAGEDLDQALFHALLSTHVLSRVENGQFVSIIDPPDCFREAARACNNVGAWPVLVGPEPGRMIIAAPIILYDYPQLAPESPGDLFDGTEIDELLSLRIQTLTDAEKQQMSSSDENVRRILERTESLSEDQLLQLHGRLQTESSPRRANGLARPPGRQVEGHVFQPGDRVRIRARRSADAMDLFLEGEAATVVIVEQDLENCIHLGVVLDDDPGRDFGVQGLPGHRFFYRPEEVERLDAG